MALKTFKINAYLTLKLEDGRTNIYVRDKLFQQCKYILLNIPTDRIQSFNDIKSIDDAAERLDRSMEDHDRIKFEITPETEFWAHCSNLQAWDENDYDTRLLHSNLSFPLLKKLTDCGDLKAKKVFKEELAERICDGNLNVFKFILEQDYLDILSEEEKEIILDDFMSSKFLNDHDFDYNWRLLSYLEKLTNGGMAFAKDLFLKSLTHYICSGNEEMINFILVNDCLKGLSFEALDTFFKRVDKVKIPDQDFSLISRLLNLFIDKGTEIPQQKIKKRIIRYFERNSSLDRLKRFLDAKLLKYFSLKEKKALFRNVEFGEIVNLDYKNSLPLLKEIFETGISRVKDLLKFKIKNCFPLKNPEIYRFILQENYLKYLSEEEIEIFFQKFNPLKVKFLKLKVVNDKNILSWINRFSHLDTLELEGSGKKTEGRMVKKSIKNYWIFNKT